MFYVFCTLLYVHSSIAIILMGKRELIALLNLSSWCLVMVERLFLAGHRGCLQFVIVVFPGHTHLLFLTKTLQIPQPVQHTLESICITTQDILDVFLHLDVSKACGPGLGTTMPPYS